METAVLTWGVLTCLMAAAVSSSDFAVDNSNSEVHKHPKALPKKVAENEGKIKDLIRTIDLMTGNFQPSCAEAMGCHKDSSSGRALSGSTFRSNDMTHEKCIKFCAGKLFIFAGLQYYNECYCGGTYDNDRYGPANPSDCSARCRGNQEQMCGGSYRNTMLNLTKCYQQN